MTIIITIDSHQPRSMMTSDPCCFVVLLLCWSAQVSLDGTLRVWDRATCLQLYEFSAAGEVATCLAYSPSPDTHLLAVGYARGHVRLFDVAATRTLVEYQQHGAPVCALHFSPDGRLLLSAARDGQLCVYDAEHLYLPVRLLTGLRLDQPLLPALPAPVPPLPSAPGGLEPQSTPAKASPSASRGSLTPRTKSAAKAGGSAPSSARRPHLQSSPASLSTAPAAASSEEGGVMLAVNRRGTLLAVASTQRGHSSVLLLDTRTWSELRRLPTGLQSVAQLDWLQHPLAVSARLARPDADEQADAQSAVELLARCRGDVLSVVGAEGRVVLLLVDASESAFTLPRAEADWRASSAVGFRSFSLSAGGYGCHIAYSGADSLLHVARRTAPFSSLVPTSQSLEETSVEEVLSGAPQPIRSMFWSPDSQQLFCASGSAILVWQRTCDDAPREQLEAEALMLLAGQVPDHYLRLLPPPQPAVDVTEQLHGSEDAHGHDVDADTALTHLPLHSASESPVSASRVSFAQYVRRRRPFPRQLQSDEPVPCGPISSLETQSVFGLSADGRRHLLWHQRGGFLVFASGCAVLLMDLHTRIQRVLGGTAAIDSGSHTEDVNCLALSTDGLLVASGSGSDEGGSGASILLWGTRRGELVGCLRGHPRSVQSLTFDHSGQLLLSLGTDEDGYLCVWHVPSQRLLARALVASLGETCAHQTVFLSSPFDSCSDSTAVPPLVIGCAGRQTLSIWTLAAPSDVYLGAMNSLPGRLVGHPLARTTTFGDGLAMSDLPQDCPASDWIQVGDAAGRWLLRDGIQFTALTWAASAHLLVAATSHGAVLVFKLPAFRCWSSADMHDGVSQFFRGASLGGRLYDVTQPVSLLSVSRPVDFEVTFLQLCLKSSHLVLAGSAHTLLRFPFRLSKSACTLVPLPEPFDLRVSEESSELTDSTSSSASHASSSGIIHQTVQPFAAPVRRPPPPPTVDLIELARAELLSVPSFIATSPESEVRLDGSVLAVHLDASANVGVAASSAGSVWQLHFSLPQPTNSSKSGVPSQAAWMNPPRPGAMRLLHSHTGFVQQSVFHPDEADVMASASADGSLRVWKRSTHQQILHFQVVDSMCLCVHFSGAPSTASSVDQTEAASATPPSQDALGQLFAGYSDGSVRRLDLQLMAVAAKTQLSAAVTTLLLLDYPTPLGWQPLLVCGCADGTLVLLDADSLSVIDTIDQHSGARIDALDVCRDAAPGLWLAVDSEGRLSVWQLHLQSTDQSDESSPTALVVAGHTSAFTIVAGLSRWLHLAHFYSSEYRPPTGHEAHVPPSAAAFWPGRPNLVWCFAPSQDHQLLCLDLAVERVAMSLSLPHALSSLAASPDGRLLALGCEDRVLLLLELTAALPDSDPSHVLAASVTPEHMTTPSLRALLRPDALQQSSGFPDLVTHVSFAHDSSALVCSSFGEIQVLATVDAD